MRADGIKRRIAAVVATVVCFFAIAATANAALDWYYYTYPNTLASGATYQDTYYVSSGHAIRGWSYNGARPQEWFNNSAGARVSAVATCETYGCQSSYSWSPGPFPSGYPAIHHHGLGANPDVFDGQVFDSR